MGEALISRSTLIPDEVLNPIYPTTGYCTLVVTVLDRENKPFPNIMTQCNANGTLLNYSTNDKGKVKFVINSGIANISILNRINDNGQECLLGDYLNIIHRNIAAPIGDVVNINLQANTSRPSWLNIDIWYDNVIFWDAKRVDGILQGAGGGGGGATWIAPYLDAYAMGGNGGNGYKIEFNNFHVDRFNKYKAYTGYGGFGGTACSGNYLEYKAHKANNGSTGATTRFANYSAPGGAGGQGGIVQLTQSERICTNGSDGVGGNGIIKGGIGGGRNNSTVAAHSGYGGGYGKINLRLYY